MRDHRLHQRGFTDDARLRPDARCRQIGNHAPDADATDFFIVRERKVQRRIQPTFDEFRQQRQRHRNKAFHVRGAAPIKFSIALNQRKRIGIPCLALYRHHIGMAREHNASFAARTQSREQIGLAFIVVKGQPDIGIVRAQVLAHEINQIKI